MLGMSEAQAYTPRRAGRPPKLPPEQEAELVRRYDAGLETVTALGDAFGVSRQSVRVIVRRVKKALAQRDGDAA